MSDVRSPTSRKRRKRGFQELSNDHKRQRSQSRPKSIDEEAIDHQSPLTPDSRPPPGYDLDLLSYHIDLRDFGKALQDASNAVFSSDRRGRYTHVSALLMSWVDEDPQLPVSLEVVALKSVLIDIYGFDVEEYQIPSVNSHMEVNLRVLNFLKDSDAKHLKVIYYAGHGKLSNHGQSLWTSRLNSLQDRCPIVKWSGIQTVCEESQSDVLILLDCCASGLSNTDEGNGTTELIAACAFNGIANGVGRFSFTHALISQLQKLAHMPSFTVGYLYNLVFTEVQGWQVEDPRYRKPPVHLVLTQNHRFPRSIKLSPKRMQQPPLSSSNFNSPNTPPSKPSNDPWNNTGSPASASSKPSESPADSGYVPSPTGDSGGSSKTSAPPLPEYPRILLSIRVSQDLKPKDLSTGLFTDWLGTLPMATESVRIEAGFASDSTLLLLSMPIALLGYITKDPAITMLGISRSANLFPVVEEVASPPREVAMLSRTDTKCELCEDGGVNYIGTEACSCVICMECLDLERQKEQLDTKCSALEKENTQLRSWLTESEELRRSHRCDAKIYRRNDQHRQASAYSGVYGVDDVGLLYSPPPTEPGGFNFTLGPSPPSNRCFPGSPVPSCSKCLNPSISGLSHTPSASPHRSADSGYLSHMGSATQPLVYPISEPTNDMSGSSDIASQSVASSGPEICTRCKARGLSCNLGGVQRLGLPPCGSCVDARRICRRWQPGLDNTVSKHPATTDERTTDDFQPGTTHTKQFIWSNPL